MEITEKWKAIQRFAGATADGIPGEQTAQAVTKKLLGVNSFWEYVQETCETDIDGIPGVKTADAIINNFGIDTDMSDKVSNGDLITDNVRRICGEVLSVFETGTKAGDYTKVTIYADGPNGARQITYGKNQTTESGNLKTLLKMYLDLNPDTNASKVIANRYNTVGQKPYKVGDTEFIDALKVAGKEDKMKEAQDEFFDKVYFVPAFNWFKTNGFTLPLSMLVIFDSFIHSGSIMPFLRNRFAEVPPAKGGDEKKWITAYVNTRHSWLANHSNSLLQKTIYRTNCFKDAISKDNWYLEKPLNANGTIVS